MKLFKLKKELVISKQVKYTTCNLISRYLIGNYFGEIGKLLSDISFENVLEVGCGEGIFLHQIQEYLIEKKVYALDTDYVGIEKAKKNITFAKFIAASAYNLPFPDNEFDLVICCEVLEHLQNVNLALQEVQRVSAKHLIFSVPSEPTWRLLNIARGSYITKIGNTPGHINHWNSKSFQRHISEYFQITDVIKPIPWVVIYCQNRK